MDIVSKKYIFSSIAAIIVTAVFESVFVRLVIETIFTNAEHPWRYYGSFISALSGMVIFSIPILMKNTFDEDKRFALLMGLAVAGLFIFNDLLYYIVIKHTMTISELLAWILLELTEFSFMAYAYYYFMKSDFVLKLLEAEN